MKERFIDNYELERRLGSGGFATVWLAHDLELDGKVAIKVLADNWASEDEVRARFQEEARMLHRAGDPHFVRVFRTGELETGQPYIVMEYADRGTLADRLNGEAGSRLSVHNAVDLIDEVARCVEAVHAHGFIHRDIKPANILITSRPSSGGRARAPLEADERLLLADFGLARDMVIASGFTMASGSPPYMAPEQARMNYQLDNRVDIHALGVLAFELLVRAASSPGADVVSFDRVPISSIEPRLAAFNEVILRATAFAPEDRYDDIDDFIADLRRAEHSTGVVEQTPAAGARPVNPAPRRPGVASVVGAAAVVGLVALAGWRLLPGDTSNSDVSAQGDQAVVAESDLAAEDQVSVQTANEGDDALSEDADERRLEGCEAPGIVVSGAFDDQPEGPAYCNVVAMSPDHQPTSVGPNWWIDEFATAVPPVALVDDDYTALFNINYRSRFWLNGTSLLLDIEGGAEPDLALLRANKSFAFEDDGLVIELDAAAADYGEAMAPAVTELVVAQTSSIRSGDSAVQSFWGEYVFGCEFGEQPAVSCDLFAPTDRQTVDEGLIWRVTSEGVTGVEPGSHTVGDLDAMVACGPGDASSECTNRFRVELGPGRLRVEANGQLLVEHADLPDLPTEFTARPVFVYFAGRHQALTSDPVRFTWHRLAVNPEAGP